ncbi:MAG TPA: TonB-dependent receptor [Burkholderiaceae bacterium]|nr:TonB-dependent receptor [Burkholderiaceae bacterium]
MARGIALAFGGLAAALPASQVLAQQQQQLERVEITGSRIRRVDAETAAPVQTITREDIERTGKTSIQEILRTVTADSNGTIPTSFTNGFASGSAAVSLRGLGVNSTLVLVNGRRMSTYGLADDGTRNFVDLNSLPLEAVDRIEILKDGASAIYGADAVGGVVNVILRRNYTGASIGGSYGQTGEGDGEDMRVYGSYGFGNLDTDKYNVFFTLEGSKTKNILSTDRGFLGELDFRSRGYYDTTNGANRPYFSLGPTANSPHAVIRNPVGNVRTNLIPCDASLIDPSTGLCRYNAREEQEIQPETDRLNLYGRGTMQFSPTLTGYAELGYFNTKTKSQGTFGANNDGGVYVPGDPFNPLLVHGPMNLPASHPDNPFGVDRALFYVPAELGGRDQETNNTVFRGLIGLSGSNYGWDWDTGLLYVKSTLENDNFGFIIYNEMQAALNNGTYRITRPSLKSPSPTDPAVLARVSPTLSSEPTSSVTSLDFKASRELMTLAGGPLGLALGAEIRREEAEDPGVPGTETGSIVGLGYSKFSMDRDIYAVYGEVVAPVTKWLEVNAALRWDDYSDFGSTVNPKIGFKARPNDMFAIRGTYSEAFRAPGAAEVGGSSFGFTSYGILSQGNPDIQPEEAKSYTIGVVFEPWAGTSFTLDYWKIDRENEIVQADPNTIIGNSPTTGVPLSRINGALPGTFIYYDVDGNIGTVTGFYQNAAQTKTDGFDFSAQHRMSLQDYGRLSGQVFWTHVNSLERTDAFGNTFEYAGTHGPLVQSSGTGAPKDRATATLTWDRGPYALTLAINYTSSITMVDHEGELSETDGTTVHNSNTGVDYPDNGSGNLACGVFTAQGDVWNGNCKLGSFTTFDLFAKWSPTKNWDINFSVQNLFGKEAEFDPYLVLTYGINYNQAYHQAGAVGRFYTLGARYRF